MVDICIYTGYNMIKSWKHKGLKKFFETGSKAGIQPRHAEVKVSSNWRLIFQFEGGHAFNVNYLDYH